VIGRAHPTVEVGALPNRPDPAELTAEAMSGHSFPCSRQALGGTPGFGSDERVDVIVHHNNGE
jgi:hypothetical protein